MKNRFKILLMALLSFSIVYSAAINEPTKIDIELLEAAKAGDVKLIEKLLKSGANLNATFASGSIIHYAAYFGQVQSIIALVAAKADVNMKSGIKNTPLHEAARASCIDVKAIEAVKLLIDLKADVNALNESGGSPLDFSYENSNTLQLLIAHNASIDCLRVDKWSPLLGAANWGKSESAKVLLDNDIDYNFNNEHNKTALRLVKERLADNWNFSIHKDLRRIKDTLIEYSNRKVNDVTEIIIHNIALPLPLAKIIAKLAFEIIG